MISPIRSRKPGDAEAMVRKALIACALVGALSFGCQRCKTVSHGSPGKALQHGVAACQRRLVLPARATPEALPQVFVAAAIKIRVRPPKNAEELYEVDQGTSVVKGSRKMEHSKQLR